MSELQKQLEDNPDVLSVSGLNREIKQCLESEFPLVWVKGELSNFTNHRSGHWYFSLKDEKSQIMAVMFKGHNARLGFTPKVGDEVIVRARLAVYEPRGNYQIVCEMMEPVGAGSLQKQFEELKRKLAAEGLFDSKRKQTLPKFPKQLAVVTSPTGAAIRDILNVLNRRYKGLEVTIFPCKVQGEMAAKEITRQVAQVNELGYFDVMIVGRGGGSMEDLWCFNDEALAREISLSSIPIVSAVGHEIDFTISDFVSDVRAPTPSAAAEIVCANTEELKSNLDSQKLRLWRALNIFITDRKNKVKSLQRLLADPRNSLERSIQKLDDLGWRLEKLAKEYISSRLTRVKELELRLVSPKESIAKQKLQIIGIQQRFQAEIQKILSKKRANLEVYKRLKPGMSKSLQSNELKMKALMSQLHSLSPLNVLERGYSITKSKGNSLTKASDVNLGDKVEIKLHEGELTAIVEEIR